MTAHDLWLDPSEDEEPEPFDDDVEPGAALEPDGDWGSDEIERIRDQRYDY